MSELRTQAAELAAKLLDKLAQTLSNDLKEIAVRLESELTAAGIPLREVRYMESPKYALHDYHEFNYSQLRPRAGQTFR